MRDSLKLLAGVWGLVMALSSVTLPGVRHDSLIPHEGLLPLFVTSGVSQLRTNHSSPCFTPQGHGIFLCGEPNGLPARKRVAKIPTASAVECLTE